MSKLCRFCECPVAEGGVLLSEVDQDALSSWWSTCLHVEMDAETLRDAWSCRQCVSDARFWHENCDGELEADLVWWPLNDTFYNLYKEHELKPFSLNLEKLGETDFEDLEVVVEKLSCFFCEEEFFIPANLDLHVRRNHQSATQDEPFQCLFCSKLYKTKCSFRFHLNLVHRGEGFRCKFKQCAAVLRTEENLKEHLKKEHLCIEGKKPLECKVCKIWFSTQATLKFHLQSHKRKEKISQCLFCTESFKNEDNLCKHTKENHKSEAIKCKIGKCKNYFKTKKQLQEHVGTTHTNKCTVCPSIFSSRIKLLAHLNKAHLKDKCKFNGCAFFTNDKEEMEKHFEEKHKEQKLSECVYCEKKYVRKFLSQHVRKIHSKIAIRCEKPRCGIYFKSLDDLEKHKKEGHKKVAKEVKPVACEFCSKHFLDRNSYAVHIKTHHAGEVIRCKYRNCFSFFKREEELLKHNAEKHSGKYNCARCDYNTAKRANLVEHLKRHHLPKEKKCPHCPIMFGSAARLRKHVAFIHDESKEKCQHCLRVRSNLHRHIVKINCPVCEKSFTCRKLLFDHKLKCKKVHECRECGKKFFSERKLLYHVSEKHKYVREWK